MLKEKISRYFCSSSNIPLSPLCRCNLMNNHYKILYISCISCHVTSSPLGGDTVCHILFGLNRCVLTPGTADMEREQDHRVQNSSFWIKWQHQLDGLRVNVSRVCLLSTYWSQFWGWRGSSAGWCVWRGSERCSCSRFEHLWPKHWRSTGLRSDP